MSESKVIKGQAWISGDKLVQEQIMITPGNVECAGNVVVLIEDIWADLLDSSSAKYKTNGKGFFYWTYDMTDIEDDSIEVKVKYECPRPKEGLFKEPYDPESVDGDYPKYWTARLKKATEEYEKSAAIQRKEVIFPGTEYISQTGETITIKETKINNTDIGDITNLLGLF